MSRKWALVRSAALAAMVASLGLSAGFSVAQESKPVKAAVIKAAQAADEKAEAKADDKADTYAVPESDDVATLTAFINKIRTIRPNSRDEYVNHMRKAPEALKAASEKILKVETNKDSEAYKLASGVLLSAEVQSLQQADPAKRAEVYAKVKAHIAASKLTRSEVQLAMTIARMLEYGGAPDMAAKAYGELGEMLTKSSDKEVASSAETLVGAARRMNLIGNELELKGTTVEGKPFDVSSLKGKVVLVDFWATWCGPCIAEYPNILSNYEAYKGKGFEVVGVSLDADRGALEKYVTDKHVPWVTLHENTPEARGQHPAAKYYGVIGIPTVILVNKEGKVISLNARGPELGKLLAKELGPVEKTDEKKAE